MAQEKLIELLSREAKNAYQTQSTKAQKLVEKWKKTGLLDDLKKTDKNNLAIMLENQGKQLVKEISSSGGASQEEWSGVALPLVRRVFAEISAKEFVSVQPMNLPSGLVFYLDFRYATSQPGFTTTSGSTTQDNSVFGVTNQSTDATEGLYGAGRFGYSINDYTATSLAFDSASADWEDIDWDSDLSASAARSEIFFVQVDLNNLNWDTEGVRAFYVSGSGIKAYYPRWTKAVDVTGSSSTRYVRFVVSGSGGELANETAGSCSYHKQPTSSTRGDFEATSDPAYTDAADNSIDIPEITVDMRQEPIVAKTRKLKAVWTPEFAQDLNAYHAIDAENELTGILSEYISMEIDLEILDMLIENALTSDIWSAKVGWVKTSTTDPWFTTQDAETGRTLAYNQNTWFQTLGTKLQKISNKIHQKTMRGGANFMVLGPDAATVIESIPGYAADTDGNQQQFAMGVQKVGLLNNRWSVYKNPYMTENIILMGFRGTQFLETGAVFAPYIPLIMTPLIYDPTNLTPRKGIMTRYAKKIVRPEFFGKLIMADMNYV